MFKQDIKTVKCFSLLNWQEFVIHAHIMHYLIIVTYTYLVVKNHTIIGINKTLTKTIAQTLAIDAIRCSVTVYMYTPDKSHTRSTFVSKLKIFEPDYLYLTRNITG